MAQDTAARQAILRALDDAEAALRLMAETDDCAVFRAHVETLGPWLFAWRMHAKQHALWWLGERFDAFSLRLFRMPAHCSRGRTVGQATMDHHCHLDDGCRPHREAAP